MDERTHNDGLFAFLGDIAKVIILSLIIIIPIRYFVVQPFFVRGASMEPTYDNGDYLLVDEVSYRFSEVGRGDVIIFRFPPDPSQFYIKRVVGLPGETVTVREGAVVVVNDANPEGFMLQEAYLEEKTSGDTTLALADGEYFVLGDNRDASFDSRSWGALPRRDIVGRVFLRAWPFDRLDLVDEPQYAI
jgi:signal peptidase I